MTDSGKWRKSRRSNGAAQNTCVEVRNTLDAVRDSKNPTGPTLRADLTSLLSAIKADQLG
jgi:hypothetical protein